MKKIGIFTTFILAIFTNLSSAATAVVESTKITAVFINGGTDTLQPGTSCFRTSAELSTICPAGIIGIPNNSKELISAAIAANATKANTWIYYVPDLEESQRLHCPGTVVTACSVISIALIED